jgi:N-acetylglucosamine kinase-like BadF-type ATPase
VEHFSVLHSGNASKLLAYSFFCRWTYADPSWARIAALVPVVKACAGAGDKVAQNIFLNAVQEIVASVKAVVQRLGLSVKGQSLSLRIQSSLYVHTFEIR